LGFGFVGRVDVGRAGQVSPLREGGRGGLGGIKP
jgi:hypothetical protein